MDRTQRSHGVVEFTPCFVAIQGLGTSIGFRGLQFTLVASTLMILVSLVPKWVARRQAKGSAAAAISDRSAPAD